MPVSLNGGMRMPSWFDVYDLGEGSKKYDEQGIEKAVADGERRDSCITASHQLLSSLYSTCSSYSPGEYELQVE